MHKSTQIFDVDSEYDLIENNVFFSSFLQINSFEKSAFQFLFVLSSNSHSDRESEMLKVFVRTDFMS